MLAFAISFLLYGLEPIVPAETVLLNGKIATPWQDAQALAVWKDRILAVGTNEEIKSLVGSKTQVIDLQGKRVVPGFYDSHTHFMGGGRLLNQIYLKDCPDEASVGKLLKQFDQKLPRDRWLLGGNWDHDRAFQGKLPTAAFFDQFVKDRPLFLSRYDGHMAVVNTATLKLAGITAATKDPTGGVIERDAQGNPTGILKDNAMGLVEHLIPQMSDEEILESVKSALEEARKFGVTSVQDMDGSDARTRQKLLRIYQQLAKKGELTCRVDMRWPIAAQEEISRIGVQAEFGNDYIRIGGVKGFMDGSLGSSTAKMFDPYVINPNTTGVFVTPRDTMQKLIRSAAQAKLSVAVHAIGDQANAELLSMYEQVTREGGYPDARFRIEHAQHLRVEDIRRFGKSGIVASMQPYHCSDDGRWAEGRIGAKRCQTTYAFKTLLETGTVLAFGSDWPVAPLDPITGIDSAVNRRTLDGKYPDGWIPEQKIGARAALDAYTRGSAFAAHQEKSKGSIEPGKLADLIVLSKDILDPKEASTIGETRVLKTIVGGKVVFQK
jgi:predicted amidohydrolase YtcJ